MIWGFFCFSVEALKYLYSKLGDFIFKTVKTERSLGKKRDLFSRCVQISFCQRLKWKLNEIYCGKLSCVDCRKTSTQNWTCNPLSPRPSQHLPAVPSVPQNREWLCASSAGTWLGLPPAAAPWRPQGTPRATGLTQLVRPLIAMESGWAALLCSSPHPACSFLPTRPGWAWVHITCLKQIYWLWCLVFCAQGQIEPEIQGISKLKLHPVAGSGSCYNSEVKETVCCHKIKQHFSVLPLKIFKSNV